MSTSTTLSLYNIASSLASRVGQPTNAALIEELKFIFTYKQINYKQQFLEKHPEQRKFFFQSFTTDLEPIPKGDCELPITGCEVLRSKCKIPMPIRSSYSMFDFVGTPDWLHAFTESSPEFLEFYKHNKYTSKDAKWFYMNERLYVFNNLNLKKIAVRAVFTDPSTVNSCCSAGTTCFDESKPYPMSQDLLNVIMRDILNVELRNQFPQPGVVSTTSEGDTEVATKT
jgi:hypothetical protein